jgi:hypothetical protein
MLAMLDKSNKERIGRVSVPEVGFCAVKQSLVDAFLETVHRLHVIENQQIKAVIEGDPDFSRFDLMLHFAQEQKDIAKYAWIAHVESHGC